MAHFQRPFSVADGTTPEHRWRSADHVFRLRVGLDSFRMEIRKKKMVSRGERN